MSMSNTRMQRVAELREQLATIRKELASLLKDGLPVNGGYPVSQAIDGLRAIDHTLEDALFDCGPIQGED